VFNGIAKAHLAHDLSRHTKGVKEKISIKITTANLLKEFPARS